LKRIGISQRVEMASTYYERRDCLDQAWTQLFERVGLDLVPVPNTLNDVKSWAQRQALDGILLSGGNDLSNLPNADNPAPERDACEMALLLWAQSLHLPVVGVCRGMQMINSYLGGTLTEVRGHIARIHTVRPLTNSPLFHEYSMVNSFHSWGIGLSDLAPDLELLVLSDDNVVEAFRHKSLPWFGVMWHPERDNGFSSELDTFMLQKIFNQSDQERS